MRSAACGDLLDRHRPSRLPAHELWTRRTVTPLIGVLLFQDLAVVPLLILIPALAQPPESLALNLAVATLKAVAVLGVLLVFGQRLMRGWFALRQRRSPPSCSC